MKKDLIVTTISSNYTWVDIKNWLNSIKKTDYQGDILVLAYNFNADDAFVLQLQEAGCLVIMPNNTYRGEYHETFLTHSGYVNPQNANELVHNVRLFHLWQYLEETGVDVEYNRVVFTDGRDIIFQSNPSTWLDTNMHKDILVPSEGILYKDQPWNKDNALKNYGGYVYEYLLKDRVVCNVGTFACTASICKDLCLILYLMSNNIGHADQPSFNILTSTLLKDKCQWVDYKDSWAFQIGAIVDNISQYSEEKDNILYTKTSGEPYCIVHQYDRIPHLKHHYDTKL
jgi:hypothetical protein